MELASEKFFTCPYCCESISMVFEGAYGSQTYIEDCEVCCKPIKVSYEVDDEAITIVNAERVQ